MIERELNKQYLTSQIGNTQSVLTENIKDEFMIGHTEQFVKVYLPKLTPRHQILKIRLTELFKDGMKAEVIF
jgi:hypothetical protein